MGKFGGKDQKLFWIPCSLAEELLLPQDSAQNCLPIKSLQRSFCSISHRAINWAFLCHSVKFSLNIYPSII